MSALGAFCGTVVGWIVACAVLGHVAGRLGIDLTGRRASPQGRKGAR